MLLPLSFGVEWEIIVIMMAMMMIMIIGACAGWCDSIRRWGKLTLAEVLKPAIELADAGFPVSPLTAQLWAKGVSQLNNGPYGGELLIDGKAPAAGQVFKVYPVLYLILTGSLIGLSITMTFVSHDRTPDWPIHSVVWPQMVVPDSMKVRSLMPSSH
jgi:hypothetical protein